MYKVNKIIIKVCLPNVNVILVSLPFFACLESRHLSDTQANEILRVGDCADQWRLCLILDSLISESI